MSEISTTTWRERLADGSDLPLRLILGATFIIHGYPKVFGGIEGFAEHLAKMGMPMPGLQAWLAALAEFGGGILMLLGLGTRLAALGHVVVMLVAITLVHWNQGFKMTVVDGRVGGFEWQLALLCMAICMLLRGAGVLSLDRLIAHRMGWTKKAAS